MSTLITEWMSFDNLYGIRQRISMDLINIDESYLEYIEGPHDECLIVLTDGSRYIAHNISIEQQEELMSFNPGSHQRGRT